LKQFVWAVVVSVPLAIIAFAVADNVNTPEVARWVLSPGYAITEHMTLGGTFAESLGMSIQIDIGFNMAYYLFILFVLFKVLSRRSQGGLARHR
jgi:hypothetical protein